MKKYILLVLVAFATLSASAQSKWNVGIQTGCATNVSKFESGDEEANALFNNNTYKSINLGIIFRYKISPKFSLQSGISFTEFGFSYGLAKDYSLLKPRMMEDDISTSTCISSIPALLVLNTPVNCKNTRFIFGAGLTVRGSDSNWKTTGNEEIIASEAANSKNTMMYAETKATSGVSAAATWMIGCEKLLKTGNSMNFTFQGNQGLSTIAESTVNYTASDKQYSHTFINRGSYVTFAFAYNFSPFGTRKASRALINGVN